jgi:NTP pyrophosphatase (non-canonical NTP hydrolase)
MDKNKSDMKTIIELENERLNWSLKNFPQATPISSLRKLEGEIKEVEQHLSDPGQFNRGELSEEYADCLMCLFDSAGRFGISPVEIFEAFEKKLAINKARKWEKNPDNTYSHIK